VIPSNPRLRNATCHIVRRQAIERVHRCIISATTKVSVVPTASVAKKGRQTFHSSASLIASSSSSRSTFPVGATHPDSPRVRKGGGSPSRASCLQKGDPPDDPPCCEKPPPRRLWRRRETSGPWRGAKQGRAL